MSYYKHIFVLLSICCVLLVFESSTGIVRTLMTGQNPFRIAAGSSTNYDQHLSTAYGANNNVIIGTTPGEEDVNNDDGDGDHPKTLNSHLVPFLLPPLASEKPLSKVTPSSSSSVRSSFQSSFVANDRSAGICSRRKTDKKVVCTPDFFFIGTSKCGTSSLAYYLQTHPMIVNVNQYNSESKESHRFNPTEELEKVKGPTATAHWFKKTFDSQKLRRLVLQDQPGFVKHTPDTYISSGGGGGGGGGIKSIDMPDRPLVMDYAPSYLLNDETPFIIAQTFPETYKKLKFVMIIRDPVKRTVSSWRFKSVKTEGGITPFRDVVKSGIAQAKCIESCFNRYYYSKDSLVVNRNKVKYGLNSTGNSIGKGITGRNSASSVDSKISSSPPVIVSEESFRSHCSIKSCRIDHSHSKSGYNGGSAHVVKGLYIYQLLNWLKVFDLEQFLIISLEEFVETPVGTMKKIIDFLGLYMYHGDGVLATATRATGGKETSSNAVTAARSLDLGGGAPGVASGVITGAASSFLRRNDYIGLDRLASPRLSSPELPSAVALALLDRIDPEHKDWNDLNYTQQANIYRMKKDNRKHKLLKQYQQDHKRYGWDNSTELNEYLKVILNMHSLDMSLEPQITSKLLTSLKKVFSRPNKRLFSLLNWPLDYYENEN